MPEVIVYALSGRTREQKRRLMKAITEVVAEHFAVPAAGIVVQIVESDRESKSKGGVPYADMPARNEQAQPSVDRT